MENQFFCDDSRKEEFQGMSCFTTLMAIGDIYFMSSAPALNVTIQLTYSFVRATSKYFPAVSKGQGPEGRTLPYH